MAQMSASEPRRFPPAWGRSNPVADGVNVVVVMRVLLPVRDGPRRTRRDRPDQRRHRPHPSRRTDPSPTPSSSRSPAPSSSMCPPVSEKNTSSSEGCRTSMLSTSTPAASSARTTDGRQTRRRVHAGAQVPPVVAHGDRARHQRRHGPDGSRVRLGQRHLQAGAPARLLQLLRRPLGDDPAVVHDHDVVGQLVGLLQVLRRQQHGDALAEQLPDGLPHPLPRRRVQPRRRLVQEQDRRPRHQRAGQVQPPAHAARVALDHPVGGVGQLELRQQLLGPGPGRRPGPGPTARRSAPGSGARSAGGPTSRPGRPRRCGAAPRPGAAARRSRPPSPSPSRAGPAWSGPARPSSCRRRSARAARGWCRRGRRCRHPASAWVSP